MPRRTFDVHLKVDRAIFKTQEYYRPVLVYLTSKIKIKNTTNKFDLYGLNIYNYTSILDTLEKNNGNDDEFNPEKEGLVESLTAFFSAGDNGLKSVILIIYQEEAGSKKIPEFLNEEANYFTVFLNTFKKDDSSGGDGLTIYKDHFKNFEKVKDRFFVFATKEDEIKELFKNGNSAKDRIIVFHSKGSEHIHLRFISKYLHQASIFHAVNAYGIHFSGVSTLKDDTVIGKLRKANINFYAQANEDDLYSEGMVKEGVTLDGMPIDEIFTYDYIKHECMRLIISVWNKNFRQNSKLSHAQLTGARDNAYTSAIDTLLLSFKQRYLIVDYERLSFIITPSNNQLKYILEVRITYNASINSVLLNISTEDASTYISRTRGQ